MENYSSLLIGGKQFSSRLMVGTGKYKSTQDMVESLSNSETEIITVAVRRIKNDQKGENLLEKINWKKYWMLPNTAGCVNSCLLYTSPSPRDAESSRMPSSA